MEIRRLQPSDAAALLQLVEGLAARHGDVAATTAATLGRDLSDGWIWGFAAGDPLVGYVLISRHARAQDGTRGIDLHHVFVASAARGTGVARALIAAAEEDARRLGCSYVIIGANRGNDVARQAYVALGYDWREPTFWRFRKAL